MDALAPVARPPLAVPHRLLELCSDAVHAERFAVTRVPQAPGIARLEPGARAVRAALPS